MTNEIKELLEEIQEWMMDNDYESGKWGSDIYNKITEMLESYDKSTKPTDK